MIDYGLADFEARYAAGMIGAAADQGTQQAPKEETFRCQSIHSLYLSPLCTHVLTQYSLGFCSCKTACIVYAFVTHVAAITWWHSVPDVVGELQFMAQRHLA